MYTHKLHFIRVIACIRSGIDPDNNITSGHVITRVAGTVVLDGKNLGTDDSRFAVFGSFVIKTIVAIRGIRNVVKHEFTSFFAEAFFSHGRGFGAPLARMLLYVRQGAAPVNDFVVGDIDAVGLVGRLTLTEYAKEGEQTKMDEWWHWKIID
jgi:hypothetical protein